MPKKSQKKPAWKPSPRQISATHVGQWMKERRLRRYSDLHRWSVENREAFWECAIRAVGIRFRRPPSRILDPSSPIRTPRWLPDARLNIADSCFQADPSAPAIVFRRTESEPLESMTYAELGRLSNRVANGLVSRGIRPGDGIAADLPMTAEAVALYLGVIKCGAYIIGIAESFAPPEIATRLRIGAAKLVFTQDVILRDGKSLPLYEKVVAARAPSTIVLSAGPPRAIPLRSSDADWSSFLSANDRFQAVERDPDDVTNILFSSGTTGDPKAIPWTHLTPIKCATDAYFYQDVHPGDAVAWPTSLGWMMGPWLIYAALVNRGTIALHYGLPQGRAFGEFIRDAQVKVLGLVPSLVKAWKLTDCMKGLKWKELRAFSSSGECSNAADMSWLMKLGGGRPVVEYCGGTEIGGGYITSVLALPNVPAAFNTVALGINAVILDEKNEPSRNGELYLVPPSIGLSHRLINQDHNSVYFAGCPKGPQGETLRRHGDQMENLGGGYFRAHGRVDDTMNLGGIKVSSAEIETVLNKVEGVAETAAIAVPPPGGGPSLLVIYAVPRGGQPAEFQKALLPKLQKAIKAHLNPLFKISDVRVIPALPRTATNKVMRRTLRSEYLGGRGQNM